MLLEMLQFLRCRASFSATPICFKPTQMTAQAQRPPRLCFVTVGATAAFDGLVEAVLSQSFFDALSKAEYTDLLIQYGKGGKTVLAAFRQRQDRAEIKTHGIGIDSFDFNPNGLAKEMRVAKGGEQGIIEGIVISHAGMLYLRPRNPRTPLLLLLLYAQRNPFSDYTFCYK